MLGLEQVLQRLDRIPVEIRQAVEAQVEKEAQEMAAAFRRAAPVTTGFDANPEHLRDSIEVYPGANPLRRRIIVGARDLYGKLYGSYVEFGHTNPDGTYTPAQPFFWPTYRARKKGARRRIASAATKAIKAKLPKVTPPTEPSHGD